MRGIIAFASLLIVGCAAPASERFVYRYSRDVKPDGVEVVTLEIELSSAKSDDPVFEYKKVTEGGVTKVRTVGVCDSTTLPRLLKEWGVTPADASRTGVGMSGIKGESSDAPTKPGFLGPLIDQLWPF